MKIIALDQSSTATGLSIFNNGELADYALIKPKSSKKVEETTIEQSPHLYEIKMSEENYGTTLLRISEITDLLEVIFKEEKPDVVYFEEIYSSNNLASFRSLARLQGFIAHLCHSLGVRYVIVNESKWIKYFGKYDESVKRPERKADIMKKINGLYDLDISVDDVSDALAIGTYAINLEGEAE